MPGAELTAPIIKEAEAAGPKGADRIKKAFDGKTFDFTSTKKPEAFINFVEKAEGRSLSDEGEQAVKDGRFKLIAKFDLHDYNGAVYVDNFDYTLKFLGPSETHWWVMARSGTSARAGAFASNRARKATVEFSVNPDDD